MIFKMTSTAKNNRGFVLLLSLLIASTVLTIGIALLFTATRQISLATLGAASQEAFFVSDAAMECALFWDVDQRAFATSTYTPPGGFPQNIYCRNIDVRDESVIDTWDQIRRPRDSVVQFVIPYPNGACADVDIKKIEGGEPGCLKTPGETCTSVEVNGFNGGVRQTGQTICVVSGSHTVQRSIKLVY